MSHLKMVVAMQPTSNLKVNLVTLHAAVKIADIIQIQIIDRTYRCWHLN